MVTNYTSPNHDPPTPCWHLIIPGGRFSLITQPRRQPSGPSKVTLDSSVNTTFEKSNFIYFLHQPKRFTLWRGVRRGFLIGLVTYDTFFRTLLRVALLISCTPAKLNIVLLDERGCFLTIDLIFLRSLVVTLDFPTSECFFLTKLISFIAFLIVLMSLFKCFAIWSAGRPIPSFWVMSLLSLGLKLTAFPYFTSCVDLEQ